MMSTDQSSTIHNPHKAIAKELKFKANEFLNSRRNANNLLDIIGHLEQCLSQKQPVNSCILTLEVIFTELLKRREMCIAITPLKPKDQSPETKYKEWLQERFEETLKLILACINIEKPNESLQALVTSMKLMSWEGKYPLEQTDSYCFPKFRLRYILLAMLSTERSNRQLINRFKEYADYVDIVYYSWKMIPTLATKAAVENEMFANNYLDLIDALAVKKEMPDDAKLLCSLESPRPENYEYHSMRRAINKVWNCIMQWDMKETIHKQVLIVLLERILPHLEKPILLTDFLMDSLDFGGPIGLLALQGIFTLIQKHNITYPNIYEKLYSMFEPEIFHTKFKARLFYLADIFLSSSHLPESLVAAFVKRLARLCLIAPPQDAIIILYFIGNLILRHPGLKRLICSQMSVEVSRDPFIMDEREPTKSNALESSLWEIVTMQKHALPSVATAAKFISQPLPTTEWDLSSVLEVKEDDIFDQEIAKKTKHYALAFERPNSMFLTKNDKVKQYWKLF
ncbi:nucleolar complex protein 4 homolog A [Eupeodes corollae]|uniref:nucleolar complex protein 4 homolog A n=1 Tax=Eupeodes corollae TaxID=290404 RepID=UPI0024937085|nr:nucleolar complex protein 4 homolog A [Eupeodes corollae]